MTPAIFNFTKSFSENWFITEPVNPDRPVTVPIMNGEEVALGVAKDASSFFSAVVRDAPVTPVFVIT